MGRLIAVVLFIAVLVPGVLLARAWGLAAGRRAVAAGAVEFAEPTPAGAATLQRQAQHGRRVRHLSLLLGVAGVIGSVVLLAEASVFLWGPVLAVALLLGVVARRGDPAAAALEAGHPGPASASRRADLGLAGLDHARGGRRGGRGRRSPCGARASCRPPVAWAALIAPVVAWLLAETALLRAVLRPLPAEGADVPVDEALRTWTAHLVTAAASVLALLPLGGLLLVAGIDPDRVSEGFDFLPVALVAGGFSALAAGIAVAGFLLTWLRPIRSSARALAG